MARALRNHRRYFGYERSGHERCMARDMNMLEFKCRRLLALLEFSYEYMLVKTDRFAGFPYHETSCGSLKA
jgi:hypothetical protein